MSAKIPLGETIADAYRFGFARFLSVLGIVWFPYLLLAIIAAVALRFLAPDLPGLLLHGRFDISMFVALRRVGGLLWLAGLVASGMVAVGLQRRALGEMKGPVFIFFSLDASVWRMVAAYFLALVVVLFLVAFLTLACVAVWFVAGRLPAGATAILRAGSILAALCFVAFTAVRLLFFLAPVVVAERTIGLERAWALSHGNFWRIVAVGVAIFVPVAIGFSILSTVIFGPFAMPHLTGAMSFRDIMREFETQLRVAGPFLLVFRFVERIVFFGLGNGATASAYLSVTGKSAGGSSGAGTPGG